MASYGHLVRLLIEQPSMIGISMLVSLGGGLYLLVIGAWLPWVWTSSKSREGNGEPNNGEPNNGEPNNGEPNDGEPNDGELSVLRLLTLSLGGGLVSQLVTGTASAYLFGQLLTGVLLSSGIGLVSIVGIVRRLDVRRLQLGVTGRLFAIVSVLPFLLGVWLHQISEVHYDTAYGQGVAFGGLNGDSSFHVYLASMVEQHGLPLQALYGSPDHEYAPLVHTGHGVLIASTALATGIGLFQASAMLWTAGLMLLAWTGLDVLSRTKGAFLLVLLGSLSPLVLGPIGIPSVVPFWRPGEALDQSPLVAARMYWNLPQTLSTALVGVGLICFGCYCTGPRGRRRSLAHLVLTTMFIVASGWVKPSLIIFLGPALLITLFVQRRGWRDVVVAAGVLGMGTIVYLLPMWLVPIPTAPSWSVTPSMQQTILVGRFVILGCGAVLLLSLRPLGDLMRSIGTPDILPTVTLPLIAMGGSLLFAVLFREARFMGHVAFQPNIWWGPAGCAILLIPWLIRFFVEQPPSGGWSRGLQIAGVMLLCVQAVNGIVFAFACPAINTRVYPQSTVNALERARASSSPGTTFLIDPLIEQIDLANILHRPALYSTSYMSDEDRETLDAWHELFDETFEKTNDAPWSQYDAAIVSRSATHAGKMLALRGWSVGPLTPQFDLWRRPDRRAGDVNPPMGATAD